MVLSSCRMLPCNVSIFNVPLEIRIRTRKIIINGVRVTPKQLHVYSMNYWSFFFINNTKFYTIYSIISIHFSTKTDLIFTLTYNTNYFKSIQSRIHSYDLILFDNNIN